MTALAQALRTALFHFVWQGLVAAFLLWIALFLLRKRTAHTRYLVSCAALAILTLLPVATAFLAYEAPAPVVNGAGAAAPAAALVVNNVPAGVESMAMQWLEK